MTLSAKPGQPSRPTKNDKPGPTRRARQILSQVMASFGIFICVMLAVIAIAGGGGYFAGERDRAGRATATTVAEIDLQYQSGLSDLQAGNYALAAQRFGWVMTRAPDYPGLAESLAQAQASLQTTTTSQPTLAPSTGKSAEELFNEALSFYNAQQWANAITRLQEVETTDPTYRSDEVKAMLDASLVTLGLQYLRGDRLEEGIVLLQQAEKIKPLDDQAAGERNLARLYQTGRTYESLNWVITVNNYEAIYAIAPNYRDVKTRLLSAYVKFADQLVAVGGHCDAAMLYQKALDIEKTLTVPPTEDLTPKLDAATTACANPTPTPLGGDTATPGGPTLIPSPTGGFGAVPPGLITSTP
jgi:tetratricopeptide (TPR) repeat protein